MGRDTQYRYKTLGKPASCDGEFLYLFNLNDYKANYAHGMKDFISKLEIALKEAKTYLIFQCSIDFQFVFGYNTIENDIGRAVKIWLI